MNLLYCSGVTLISSLTPSEKSWGDCAFEARLLDEPLGDQAVAAFGQDDELRLDRLALDVVGLLVAFFVDALVHELDARGAVAVR